MWCITINRQGWQFVENLTTGNYSVSIQNSVGSAVALPQNTSTLVIFDATNGARLGITFTAAELMMLSPQVSAAILETTVQTITQSGSTLTINCNLGMVVELALQASVTSVVVQNWPSAGTMGRLTINVTNSGSYTVSGFPGTTYWAGGTPPTLTASGQDTMVFVSTNGGTVFRGYVAGQAMA